MTKFVYDDSAMNYEVFDTVREAIEFALQNIDSDALFDLWNDYCGANNCDGERIFWMDEFDEYCDGMEPSTIANLLAGNNFRLSDECFNEGIYGFNSGYVSDLTDMDELRDWLEIAHRWEYRLPIAEVDESELETDE